MAEDEPYRKTQLAQDGKPRLQYVPKYSFPAPSDSAILDSPQSSLGVSTPSNGHFQDEAYLSSPTAKSRHTDVFSSYGNSSPLRNQFANKVFAHESMNRSYSNSTANNDVLPPSSAGRVNLSGNTGSYKSGRRQRPRSLYADLDAYINNTAPSLVVKASAEDLNSKSNSPSQLPQAMPTLNSLLNSQGDPFAPLSPPPGYANKGGNRSSLYSMGSNNSQKWLNVNTLSPPPTGTGISRAGSRSEYDSTGGDLYYVSRSGSPARNGSPTRRKDSSSHTFNPFNYNSMAVSNPNILQKPAHRRGHRYKHSSVSMNFFQEPKKRAQLNIPTSLPIPSVHEFFESCSDAQKFKLAWCFVHLGYASLVFLAGFQYSLACLTTLSHLVFFDSVNNFLTAIVDIFRNFEVWDKSSIKYPFGLSRLEALFGFALSISLFYVGFDLITHSLEEFIISLIDQDLNHENHHNHHNNDEHKVMSDNLFLALVFAGIGVTLISNKVLSTGDIASESIDSENKHAADEKLRYKGSSGLDLGSNENGKELCFGDKFLPGRNAFGKVKSTLTDFLIGNSIMKNPIRILTLCFSSYLIFYPYISKVSSQYKFNEIQTFIISLFILYFAFSMIKKLSLIILLSFPYRSKLFKKNIAQISEGILRLDSFKSSYKVKKILISKVNYQLFVILIKIKMTGESDNEEFRLRSDVSRVVKKTLLQNDLESIYVNFDITLDIDRM